MRLSVQIEFDKTLDLKTQKTKVIVGRAPNCDMVVPHTSISRNHCLIEYVEGEFFITDLGSSNGSFINGERMSPHARTNYFLDSQLVLGRLDCELAVGDVPAQIQDATGIFKDQAKSELDASSTMRISRLDLNKPSISLKMEKELKVSGPRNPITEDLQNDAPSKMKTLKPYLVLVVLASVQAVLMYMAMN